MNYQEFEVKLLEELRKMNENNVVIRPVLKNNGIKRNAVNILKTDEICTPNVYVDSVYRFFCEFHLTIRQAAEYVVHVYERMADEIRNGCDMNESLTDYGHIRDRLTIRMVNREQNRILLEREVVSIPFLDLAGIFCIVDSLEQMNMEMKVTKGLMKVWGTGIEELRETALRNLALRGGFQLRDIREIIAEAGSREFPQEEAEREAYMYVLTDGSMRNGPAVMFLPELLRGFAEFLGDDLLLLPSSIHELIVLRASGADPGELKRIVREINEAVVDSEEILGDHIYQYSRGQSEVTVAAEGENAGNAGGHQAGYSER